VLEYHVTCSSSHVLLLQVSGLEKNPLNGAVHREISKGEEEVPFGDSLCGMYVCGCGCGFECGWGVACVWVCVRGNWCIQMCIHTHYQMGVVVCVRVLQH